ncbi:hypothetical protein AVEN_219896-1 [Araneus ventricosus]|uniref:Uncharacterized protein n=1 Tax=Araneus ventricosus TaxID=182803 RepID=A0A4Y2VK12_ARAVE|nr:hypothetical protein AVEN_219896-1 [Araneus ventricosus]
MKPLKGKAEDKLFFTRKLKKELSSAQTTLLLHAIRCCDITPDIYRKSTIVTLFKYQISQIKTFPTSFIIPHQHQMLFYKPVRKYSQYKAVADEHNLNNRRYAAFLNSSTKIKANLSSNSSNKRSGLETRLGMCFCTFDGTCTKGAPLEEEVFGLDHLLEKHAEIRSQASVKMGYVYNML